ncbi:MAG TPA: hypothetical protein VFF73_06810 [Planctomycetota bacterium]|nr:hypothetical protein [Planctomycetota bacterium]
MSLRLTLGVAALLLAGCVGSNVPYRPYATPDGRELRPVQEVRSDPIRDEVELRHGEVPGATISMHATDEDSDYITVTRREHQFLLDRVHRNDDGTVRNAWNAYAKDMNGTLGAGTVREAPRLLTPEERMKKRSEKGEGEGEDAAPKAADKPAEKGDAMEKKE